MKELRYTLLSDGSSDRALLPVLSCLLRQHLPDMPIQAEWADLRRLPRAPRKLAPRIRKALEVYPCDVLFIHRDAEGEPRERRIEEIHEAAVGVSVAWVGIVPVRMQEAWLLFDEAAIRSAAGNPRGDSPLPLPDLAEVESLPDPKSLLHELLRSASGLQGRRRKKFSAPAVVHRVADLIPDFSPLRRLSAFQALEQDLSSTLARLG